MATFPTNIIPQLGTKDDTYLPVIRVESERGYPKTRRLNTKSRFKSELMFNAITLTEFNTLETFFIANQGIPFTYIHPITAVSYDCTFMQDSLTKRFITPDIVSTKIMIEEV